MVRRGLLFAGLAAIWVVLSGKLDGFHLVSGLLCCALVTWISGDLFFGDKPRPAMEILVESSRLLVSYLPWLCWQVVLANIQVLQLALQPGPLKNLDPQIVRYQTFLKRDFARFVFANSITLTPGTITLEMEGDHLYVHAINQAMVDGIGGEMERRIAWVFGESSR